MLDLSIWACPKIGETQYWKKSRKKQERTCANRRHVEFWQSSWNLCWYAYIVYMYIYISTYFIYLFIHLFIHLFTYLFSINVCHIYLYIQRFMHIRNIRIFKVTICTFDQHKGWCVVKWRISQKIKALNSRTGKLNVPKLIIGLLLMEKSCTTWDG